MPATTAPLEPPFILACVWAVCWAVCCACASCVCVRRASPPRPLIQACACGDSVLCVSVGLLNCESRLRESWVCVGQNGADLTDTRGAPRHVGNAGAAVDAVTLLHFWGEGVRSGAGGIGGVTEPSCKRLMTITTLFLHNTLPRHPSASRPKAWGGGCVCVLITTNSVRLTSPTDII